MKDLGLSREQLALAVTMVLDYFNHEVTESMRAMTGRLNHLTDGVAEEDRAWLMALTEREAKKRGMEVVRAEAGDGGAPRVH